MSPAVTSQIDDRNTRCGHLFLTQRVSGEFTMLSNKDFFYILHDELNEPIAVVRGGKNVCQSISTACEEHYVCEVGTIKILNDEQANQTFTVTIEFREEEHFSHELTLHGQQIWIY